MISCTCYIKDDDERLKEERNGKRGFDCAKIFSISHNNGEMWSEELDSLYNFSEIAMLSMALINFFQD